MNTHIRSFEDQAQRDWPDDDCSELSRGEMLRNRVSWDYRDSVEPARLIPMKFNDTAAFTLEAPAPSYHGFSKPPEPAKPYPGRYRSAAIYGLCFVMAVGGFGGLIVYAGKLAGL